MLRLRGNYAIKTGVTSLTLPRLKVGWGMNQEQQHKYDVLDPLVVVLRNRFNPDEKKTYKADCPLDAYLAFRPLRKDWVVESMTYLNNPERPIEY